MSGTAAERPGAPPSPSEGDETATSIRTDAPTVTSSGATHGGSSAPEPGGLNDYLTSLSTLGLNPSVDGPKRLSAAEVRRHTTGRMRAITDAPDPPRRPTTGHTRAVSDVRAASRTGTGRMPVIPDASFRTSTRHYLLPALAVLCACAIFLPRLFSPAVPAALPKEMRGEWMTSHPQYASRRLVFTATEVGIAVNETRAPAMHQVTAVQATGLGDTTRYVITYEQDGEAVQFQLQFTVKPQRRVVLANPPDVLWYPVSEAPIAIPPVLPIPADSVPLPDLVPRAR